MPVIDSDFTIILLTADQKETGCQQMIHEAQSAFPKAKVDLINLTKAKLPKDGKLSGNWISKKTFSLFGHLPSPLQKELQEKKCNLLLFTGEQADVFIRHLALTVGAQFRASFAQEDDPVFQLQLHADPKLPLKDRLKQLEQYLKLLKGNS